MQQLMGMRRRLASRFERLGVEAPPSALNRFTALKTLVIIDLTPSVHNYKLFHLLSESDVYRRVLVCLFTHFSLYVVQIEILKASYICEPREYIVMYPLFCYTILCFFGEKNCNTASFLFYQDQFSFILWFYIINRDIDCIKFKFLFIGLLRAVYQIFFTNRYICSGACRLEQLANTCGES